MPQGPAEHWWWSHGQEGAEGSVGGTMLTLRARGLHGSRAHGCAAKGFVIDMDRVGDKMCGQGRSGWVKCSSACQAPHLPLLKESRTHFFPIGYQEHISTQLLATIWCPFCLSQGLSSEPSVSIRGDEMGCARDNGMGWDKTWDARGSSASEKLGSSSQGRALASNGGGSPVPVEPVDQRVPVEVLKAEGDRSSLAESSPNLLCCYYPIILGEAEYFTGNIGTILVLLYKWALRLGIQAGAGFESPPGWHNLCWGEFTVPSPAAPVSPGPVRSGTHWRTGGEAGARVKLSWSFERPSSWELSNSFQKLRVQISVPSQPAAVCDAAQD